MAEPLTLFPVSARTWLLGLTGLVTAVTPELVAQPRLASTLGHVLLGAAILTWGLWRCWHPLVTISDGVLRYTPRFGSGATTLPLIEVARVLAPVRTGHGPSERDLAAQLGVALRTGGFRWIDLSELRARDRARVRERVGGNRAAPVARAGSGVLAQPGALE